MTSSYASVSAILPSCELADGRLSDIATDMDNTSNLHGHTKSHISQSGAHFTAICMVML